MPSILKQRVVNEKRSEGAWTAEIEQARQICKSKGYAKVLGAIELATNPDGGRP